MVGERLVRTTLAKADDAFEMFLDGRISQMILAVNLERHAADLRAFAPEAADRLRRLQLAIAGADKAAIRALRKDLERIREGVEAEQEGQPMSMEEIERILADAKKSL